MARLSVTEREAAAPLLRNAGLHSSADQIEDKARKRCVVCSHVFDATRSDARTCSPKCRKALSRNPKKIATMLPYVRTKTRQPFATAIIDPDWPYTIAPGVDDYAKAKGNGRLSGFTRNRDRARNVYRQRRPLSLAELRRVPVGEMVSGYVLLWTVGPFLISGAASDTMRAWGFEPVR